MDTAERKIGDRNYHTILTDLHLSARGDGEGMGIISKARKKLPEAKVIMMTASHAVEAEKEAYRRGANYFIRKPFKLQSLTWLLEETANPDSRIADPRTDAKPEKEAIL